VNNSSNEEVAHRMRSRCKILVAFGDCAVFGGVPALRNMCGTQEALQRAYVDIESNDESGKIPNDPELAVMSNVRALHEVVDVDLHVPRSKTRIYIGISPVSSKQLSVNSFTDNRSLITFIETTAENRRLL